MIYFLIYLLIYPYLFAMKKLKFKGAKGKILLIQTAKIGDYANSTVIFEKLGKFDALIDEINLAFAKHDSRIEKIFTINGIKRLQTRARARAFFAQLRERLRADAKQSKSLFSALHAS